jgi:hypothetical protein
MAEQKKTHIRKFYLVVISHVPVWAWRWLVRYWRQRWWHKLIVSFTVFIVLCLGTMYGIAQWYIRTQSSKPLVLGASFIADYASSLGLDPHAVMKGMADNLHVKQFRLVSYWSDIEQQPGTYNFSELDWEFQQAAAVHAKVSLSIGLRQPRWPECHAPDWAANEPVSVWQPQLMRFMQTVINRYKNSHALDSYQLENEYFLENFGGCTDFSRQRLIDEFNLVKKTDPDHPVIMTRSDNMPVLPLGQPRPDEFGISVYRRVWSPPIHRYFQYPLPAWYYAFLAGAQKILTGRDTMVHELQGEPWPPNGESITQSTLGEQNESLNAKELTSHVKFGEATGMRTINLWGAEYWYYRMTVLHDPSVWNAAKQAFAKANN